MNFHIARTAATTGNILRTLVQQQLAEQGIRDRTDAQICYGVGTNGNAPALNANCSRYNKLEQTRRLREGLGPGGLAVFDTVAQAVAHLESGGRPLFARDLVHSRGRDIKLVLEPWQVAPVMAAGAAFFTVHEPSVREFRVWVYRKRHLGTYEKVLRRPEECKRLGRNYANGFDFSGVENDNVPEALKDIARRAIRVLDLDFGAVDILQAADGRYVVLEVNSAPGVSDERRKVIQGLAKRIVRWVANDCPRAATLGEN